MDMKNVLSARMAELEIIKRLLKSFIWSVLLQGNEPYTAFTLTQLISFIYAKLNFSQSNALDR